ncbi:hypothetical protein BUALT_Bualt01G0105300 [Buddleja alternifolia]|uniref:Uncharacterized protein n=1 Tax=Buddleja alternifolia TaxID=168488 RepID=A0AAV6YCL8_9LAMI|nr:hypothetical protein BUALT_Bualt01G0105300 [Buddleja alternifolia]
MAGVKGIILDSSVLLASDDGDVNGDAVIRPGADYLLRKLCYSKIPTGISHEQGLSSPKECLLQKMARIYSCTILCLSREDDISSAVARIWEDKGGSYLHVVSSCGKDLCYKGNSSGWVKVIVGPTDRKSSYDAEYVAAPGVSTLFIHKLEELPLLICHLSKKAMGKEALTVGYVMKPSREEDFAKKPGLLTSCCILQRGAFPLCPTQNGLIFLPLNYELPISAQLQLVDAVLHKATDEILAVDMGSPESGDKVTFTNQLQELQRYVKCQLDCSVIDPFDNIFPILDRLKIQQILTGLGTLNIQGRFKIRAPYFLKANSEVNQVLSFPGIMREYLIEKEEYFNVHPTLLFLCYYDRVADC